MFEKSEGQDLHFGLLLFATSTLRFGLYWSVMYT